MRRKISSDFLFALLFAAVVFLSFRLASAFNPPAGSPPTGGGAIRTEPNVPANTLYLDSAGFVGIGTSEPVSKLEVSGDIGSLGKVSLSGASARVDVGSTTYLDSAGGKIGNTLTVVSGSVQAVGVLRVDYSTGDPPLQVAAGGGDSMLRLTRTGGTSPTLFKLGTDNALIINNSNLDVLTLKNGQVGINVTSPVSGFALDVGGSGRLGGGLTVVSGEVNLPSGQINSTEIADGTIVNVDISSTAAIAGTKVAPNFGSQNIVTTGSVGIGIGPAAKLHVLGSGAETARIEGKTNLKRLTGQTVELLQFLTESDMSLGHVEKDGNYYIAGTVGIGTTPSGVKLDVAGNAQLSSANSVLKINTEGQNGIKLFANVYFGSENWGTRIWKDHISDSIAMRIDTQYGAAWHSSVIIGHGQAVNIPKFGVYGGAVIGSGYVGFNTPPADGLLVQGSVGIGTVNPATARLVVDGAGGGPAIDVKNGKIINVALGATTDAVNRGYVDDLISGNVGGGSVANRCDADNICEVKTLSVVAPPAAGAVITLPTAALGTYRLEMGGGDIKAVNKLQVGTIDPVYSIDGEKFATYVASMTGIKEETTATALLSQNDQCQNPNAKCFVIDFSSLEKGSDLWLFRQVSDFGKDWENLTILLTPSFDGRVWYEKDADSKKLIIYGIPDSQLEIRHLSLEISYRLTAPRFDHKKWPNVSLDSDTGLFVR